MPAKVIMVQGTMSNVGKSFLAAGLCRIFRQDGYRVAPFKSQNMALNSYITREGLEIGRAQAMQAEAAGIPASADMNPILLKPTSHMGSQVILNGRVEGNWSAADYYREKTRFIPAIMGAFERLRDAFDLIVIEGAGSPAEINLKENDIVNMGLARMTGAPVLLAGDIDRGGVFASLYGTIGLLEPEERAMVKGLIINKFRGDPRILWPGLGMIEEKTGVKVLGVVPLSDIDLDEEDSLSERLNCTKAQNGPDIAVVRLPHISNFTDFSPFERMTGVSLRYVLRPDQLGRPDLVVLPGTKNTMGDLQWMRESGLETLVARLSGEGVPVLGICGGFQMLGKELHDPLNLEHGGHMRGMGLLDASTTFEPEKTRTRIAGRLCRRPPLLSEFEGETVSGYEIHMGRTINLGGCRELVRLDDGRVDALGNEEGTVLGTYLHGLFETNGLAKAVARRLAAVSKKPLDSCVMDTASYKEREYDKLADVLRCSLDMEQIRRIVEQGVKG